MKKIAIAADHAGYVYKDQIKSALSGLYEFIDFGTDSDSSVDYPDHVHPAASAVEKGECILGILICGSGNGVQMTANKHIGIRCALAWLPEIAALARQHNDANMLALPARFISEETAVEITRMFLETTFEGGRHQTRVNKISCI